ncbi:MAG: hypothetical protein HYS78_01165 [Parcubacteria group bacterium]|nr:hypothetical protein [Parcubacteria group bacterium]
MKHLKKEENGLNFLLKYSYLKTIENSIGSKLFRNLYFKKGSQKIDVLQNGNLSCAVFVSWILKNFNLIKEGHTTVDGTIKDLKKSGWRKIKKPKVGTILIWEEKIYSDGPHKHIGFFTGKEKAISNSYKLKIPIKHHWTFGIKNGKPVRKVTEIWWNKKLN